jgi:BMFP domain-containing protein YqiC
VCLRVRKKADVLVAQRFADYENEIRVLQAKLRQQERRNTDPIQTRALDHLPPPPPEKDKPGAGLSRFGSFITGRPMNSPTTPTSPPLSAREEELKAALIREQTARLAAESKTKEVNSEIEELSATLFQQANEMVASERKENAALKQTIDQLEHKRTKSDEAVRLENAALRDRMRLLEKKGGSVDESMRMENERLKQKIQMMEQRESERKGRLERLEAAQKRIDRVRAMLVPR